MRPHACSDPLTLEVGAAYLLIEASPPATGHGGGVGGSAEVLRWRVVRFAGFDHHWPTFRDGGGTVFRPPASARWVRLPDDEPTGDAPGS